MFSVLPQQAEFVCFFLFFPSPAGTERPRQKTAHLLSSLFFSFAPPLSLQHPPPGPPRGRRLPAPPRPGSSEPPQTKSGPPSACPTPRERPRQRASSFSPALMPAPSGLGKKTPFYFFFPLPHTEAGDNTKVLLGFASLYPAYTSLSLPPPPPAGAAKGPASPRPAPAWLQPAPPNKKRTSVRLPNSARAPRQRAPPSFSPAFMPAPSGLGKKTPFLLSPSLFLSPLPQSPPAGPERPRQKTPFLSFPFFLFPSLFLSPLPQPHPAGAAKGPASPRRRITFRRSPPRSPFFRCRRRRSRECLLCQPTMAQSSLPWALLGSPVYQLV